MKTISFAVLLPLACSPALAAQCNSGGGGDARPLGDPTGSFPRLGAPSRLGPRTGLGNPRPATVGTQWERWWEFNKQSWVRIKDSVYLATPITGLPRLDSERAKAARLRLFQPNAADRGRAALALRALLGARSKRDVEAAALLALARTKADMDVLRLLRSQLSSADPKRAEYAAIGLGMTGLDEALDDLIGLGTCNKHGHDLVHEPHVPYRVRAYALYGLALLGHQADDVGVKRRILDAIRPVLANQNRQDVLAAALNVLRLLRPGSKTYPATVLQHDAVSLAMKVLTDPRQAAQVRAHAMTAIGEVAERRHGSALVRYAVARLRDRRESHWVHESAAIALGKLAAASDKEAGRAIRDYQRKGKDRFARYLTAIALGRIGGVENRSYLIRRLAKRKATKEERPWLALGLAFLARAARAADPKHALDLTAADTIHTQLRRSRNASTVAGFATALGILEYRDAGRDLLARLRQFRKQDGPAGHIAVALSLMGFEPAKDELREIVDESFNHPRLMAQAAIALALLGDRDVTRRLLGHLAKRRSNTVHAALVQALGYIGDRRAVAPLVEMLADKKLGTVSRAFTASALGAVADTSALPWDAALAAGLNYETELETLTDAAGRGVLDTY